MSNGVWLGIDVAKESFHAAVAHAGVRPAAWASLPQARFDHTRKGVGQLLKWLKAQGVSRACLDGVCLEATGRYSRQWMDLAAERLGAVSVINPARPAAYAKSLGIRDKSDRVDACVIALQAVRDLGKNDFRRVAVQFDPQVASTLELDAADLQKRWNALTAATGEFVEVSGFDANDMTLPGKGRVWIFVIRCQFEKGVAYVSAEVNEAKRISYLYIEGDAAQSAGAALH